MIDPELESTEGVIDFVRDYAAEVSSPATDRDERDWVGRVADIARYAVAIDWEFQGPGRIDLVSAGRQDPSYATRVNLFNWPKFYENLSGGPFWEAVKKMMRRKYDYIMIDSRTGVSETAGICTVQLADVVVAFFTLNRQSIEGAASVAASVRRQRSNLRIFPVPSRVELNEKEKLESARDYARERFAPFLNEIEEIEKRSPDSYWGDVEIVYHPYYAFEEILAPFGDRKGSPFSVLASSERLTRYLSNGRIDELVAPPELERQLVLARYSLRRGRPNEHFPANRPELKTQYEGAMELASRWSNADYREAHLLDARKYSELANETELLSVLVENPLFRRYWETSRDAMRHDDRRAQLISDVAKLSRTQVLRLLHRVKINTSDLGDIAAGNQDLADEIVRLVEQRGAVEFAGLEEIVKEIVAQSADRSAVKSMTARDPRARILVVDDDTLYRRNLREFLELHRPDWGFDEAPDESEALKILQSRNAGDESIAVVITDLVMASEQGGLRLIKRAREKDPWLQVILYSRDAKRLENSMAHAIGAFDVLDIGQYGYEAFDQILARADAALRYREAVRRNLYLRRFLSHKLLPVVEGDPELLRPRQQVASICFCEICNFAHFCEVLRTDPVLIAGFLKEYGDSAARIIFENDGMLDKYMGDEVMALFGILDEAGNQEGVQLAAANAVSTALELQAEFNLLLERWGDRFRRRSPTTIALRVRCGIHTGDAFVGNIGTVYREQFTALGSAVNIAEGIMRGAEAGQILISQSTMSYVQSEFDCRRAEGIKIAEGELPLFRVIGPRSPAGRALPTEA